MAVYRVRSPGGVTPGVRGGVRYGPRHPGRRPAPGLTTPSRATHTAIPGNAPYAPPPLPSGSYNPERDISTEESQRGLEQLEGQIGTGRLRSEGDYAIARQRLEGEGGEQTADFNRAQQMLAQSYQRLGVKQEEGANAAGVLQGGALLQAAQKRAANEAQQSAVQRTGYERQQAGIQRALAALGLAQGRQQEDYGTQLTNAQSNNAFYGENQQKLAGAEAAERGYVPPAVPRRLRPVTRGPGGTWSRVGGRYM